MANWKYTLDIKEAFRSCERGDISVIDLTKIIVEKLKALNIKNDTDLDDVLMEFEDYINCGNEDKDEFDCILENLYDWGDYNRKCWIKII